MVKIRKISAVLFLSLIVVLFSGCNSCQQSQKGEKQDAGDLKEQINSKLQEEKNELQQKAGEEFSNINDKVIELNSKIEEQSEQLTEEQNNALDEIQEKRVAVNEKYNNIKNVSEEEWDAFRAAFENEIDEIKSNIDDILNDF